MRKLLFGLLGLATLSFGAFSAQEAQAQPYYGYRSPAVEYRTGPVTVQYGRPYRYDRYGPRYRPYRPARAARRCWTESRRVWNGYRWVRRPIEVCRTVRRPGYRW